jgi:hypothetical protein
MRMRRGRAKCGASCSKKVPARTRHKSRKNAPNAPTRHSCARGRCATRGPFRAKKFLAPTSLSVRMRRDWRAARKLLTTTAHTPKRKNMRKEHTKPSLPWQKPNPLPRKNPPPLPRQRTAPSAAARACPSAAASPHPSAAATASTAAAATAAPLPRQPPAPLQWRQRVPLCRGKDYE